MLYKRLIINGTEYLLAVSQAGSGAPAAAGPGAVGVFYMDTDTGDLYKCTGGEEGAWVWEAFGASDTGADGGYYTPSVTQPDANTMQVAFTASKEGMPAVEAVEVALPQGEGSGGGLGSAASALLITILRNGVYSTDQSANITALETALASGESGGSDDGGETATYTITNTLTNVTSNNSATSVDENTAYTATLTVADGYELDTVTVTMGGVDVTSEVVSNGIITIPAVTGDIVITATAKIAGLLYSLSSPFEAGTGKYINTKVNPVDSVTASATWIVELKDFTGGSQGVLFGCKGSSTNHLLTVWQNTNSVKFRTLAGDKTVSVTVADEFVMKLICSYDATTKILSYLLKAASEVSGEIDLSSYEIVDMTATTIIGALSSGTSSGGYELPNGTISRFDIYGRAFTADEMAAAFD